MRLKHKAAKYYDEDGHRVELLPPLWELAAGEVLDVTLHYYSEPRKPASENRCAFARYEKVLSRRNGPNERRAAK